MLHYNAFDHAALCRYLAEQSWKLPMELGMVVDFQSHSMFWKLVVKLWISHATDHNVDLHIHQTLKFLVAGSSAVLIFWRFVLVVNHKLKRLGKLQYGSFLFSTGLTLPQL
jgi:hypothetical protein